MSPKKHRASSPLETLDLPDISTFSEEELLVAQVSVGIVRSGGVMYEGRLLECTVARILKAKFPRFGTSPWDLLMEDGTRVEVRSGTKSFSLKGKKDVHCWVFVHKHHASGPRYTVVSADDMASIRRQSISAERLIEQFGLVSAKKLPACVRICRNA
ncbi:MAG: hypothetical protein ACKO2G_14015 [Verrucomicrobiales bacterium]